MAEPTNEAEDAAGDFGSILTAVQIQTREVGDLRRAVDRLSNRWKWARWAVVACLLVGSLSLGVGCEALQTAHNIVANRTNSRIVNCKDANSFGSFHDALLDAVEGIIRAVAVPQSDRTPKQQADAEKFAVDNLARLETTRVVQRDCSPDAVNAYYNAVQN